MNSTNLIAIYDFELFPYALGDVLTWNIRTAMSCDEYQLKAVDIYICLDKKHPASIYQQAVINEDNCDLFFTDLYSAFCTHPRLGNIFIFRQRDKLCEALEQLVTSEEKGIANIEAINDYLEILKHNVKENSFIKSARDLGRKIYTNPLVKKLIKPFVPTQVRTLVRDTLMQGKVFNDHFIKYIHSHQAINQFYVKKGYIPLLEPALGCGPDIDELIAQRFQGKKIVPFHLRLRRLDKGYGGSDSYARDSDFFEWYDFIREARIRYPDVIFIALGRIQEKPLELLRLPNVINLRTYGMGLGHELTLMLQSDFFIGTSSGFAAFANFSAIPYFITRMNPGSCHAYDIPEGTDKLPFAKDTQKLIYAQETSELLMDLLERGLDFSHSKKDHHQDEIMKAPSSSVTATISRFHIDEKYRNEETRNLLLPYLERIQKAYTDKNKVEAEHLLERLEKNFPELCNIMPPYLLLKKGTTSISMP